MKHLKILSYNIHKGFSANNQQFVLRKIKHSIEAVHADLVLLQEVLGHHAKHASKVKQWPTTSQFEFLGDKLWPHYAYGKNAVYTSGHHGNAILSKYPITSWDNLDISMSRLERRGLLHAVIALPGKSESLHAICLHLGLFEWDRRKQVDLLCDRINSLVPKNAPLIIGGDFNDWRQRISPTLKKRLGVVEAFHQTDGMHARTFPAWLPVLRLDRIYLRGVEILKTRALTEAPWSELSDHVAIYTEVGLQ